MEIGNVESEMVTELKPEKLAVQCKARRCYETAEKAKCKKISVLRKNWIGITCLHALLKPYHSKILT